MGPDYEGDYHRSTVQSAEHFGREEGSLAEGVVCLVSAMWQLSSLGGAKFTDALKAKEQEERDARLSKLRPALRNMLKGNPSVFHYTTFNTADKLFQQHPIWQQARIESERKLIFEEYVAELKQREVVCAMFGALFD